MEDSSEVVCGRRHPCSLPNQRTSRGQPHPSKGHLTKSRQYHRISVPGRCKCSLPAPNFPVLDSNTNHTVPWVSPTLFETLLWTEESQCPCFSLIWTRTSRRLHTILHGVRRRTNHKDGDPAHSNHPSSVAPAQTAAKDAPIGHRSDHPNRRLSYPYILPSFEKPANRQYREPYGPRQTAGNAPPFLLRRDEYADGRPAAQQLC